MRSTPGFKTCFVVGITRFQKWFDVGKFGIFDLTTVSAHLFKIY
jgi:hypothetical protein